MAVQNIPEELRVRYQCAAEALAKRAAGLYSSDATVDQDTRKWLDDAAPLVWQNAQGITPDEYFFITTLYGPMNSKPQLTVIRKFFGPLFLQAAGHDIGKLVPEMPEFAGLPWPYMKPRLCKMGRFLRSSGISMQGYVEDLKFREKEVTPENPTPALDKIIQDHRATGWKTLSVFVRDCVKGNCFPIDSRVEQQLVKYGLPVNERRLVRICLDLGRNPREDARMFYEAPFEGMNVVGFVDLHESEPCVFCIRHGQGWHRDASRMPVREQGVLTFEVCERDSEHWNPIRMALEDDGLYHWRADDGHGHWWGFLSETRAHIYLTGNYINPDGRQGVQVSVWPKA